MYLQGLSVSLGVCVCVSVCVSLHLHCPFSCYRSARCLCVCVSRIYLFNFTFSMSTRVNYAKCAMCDGYMANIQSNYSPHLNRFPTQDLPSAASAIDRAGGWGRLFFYSFCGQRGWHKRERGLIQLLVISPLAAEVCAVLQADKNRFALSLSLSLSLSW